MNDDQEKDTLYSYRCDCGRMLFKGFLLDSTVQIKCKRCGKLMAFQGLKEQVLPDVKFGMMFNRHGYLVSASSNIQKLFGHALSDLLAKHYGDLLQAADREVSKRGFEYLWSLPGKEQYFYCSKATFRNKNGVDLPGVIQSKFVVKGSHELLFCVFRSGDSLDMMETEEFAGLREYPFILHVSPDGICTDASAARRKPYSWTRSEIIGKPFAQFIKAGHSMQKEFSRRLAAKKSFSLLGQTFVRADGGGVRMDVFFNPNFSRDGTCTDYTAFVVSRESLLRHEQ